MYRDPCRSVGVCAAPAVIKHNHATHVRISCVFNYSITTTGGTGDLTRHGEMHEGRRGVGAYMMCTRGERKGVA